MTFAAVLAVIGIGVPASQWALGWLRDALKDFDDATCDATLPIEVSDWRVARRVWCELRSWPTWVMRFPYKLLLLTGEALIVSLAVEMVFTVFMVESFHRLSPISRLLNIPAGIAAAIVTPLALLLVFLPGPAAAPITWAITNLLDLLLKTLHLALQIPYVTVRVPSPPVGVGWRMASREARSFFDSQALEIRLLGGNGRSPRVSDGCHDRAGGFLIDELRVVDFAGRIVQDHDPPTAIHPETNGAGCRPCATACPESRRGDVDRVCAGPGSAPKPEEHSSPTYSCNGFHALRPLLVKVTHTKISPPPHLRWLQKLRLRCGQKRTMDVLIHADK
jgi:hypothetical protein